MVKELTYKQVVDKGLGKDTGGIIGQFFLSMPMMVILKHVGTCPQCKKKFKLIEAHSGHPLMPFLPKTDGEKKP